MALLSRHPKASDAQRISRACAGWMRRFVRDEDGVLVGFAVFMFIMIIMIGGVGIDVIRSEMKRTRMQHTLDRAILAAADLNQERDPSAVVQDYFAKSGMTDYLTSVQVDDGLNYRVVEASAAIDLDMHFMKMFGIDTVTVPASGRAEERIGGVEISLVLDVSGSMNSSSRLTNLKVAAKDFIETLGDNTDDGKLSISIVPYATQVAVPEEVFAAMNVTLGGPLDPSNPGTASVSDDTQGYSHCINFTSDDFEQTAMDPTIARQQTMHFDPWYDRDGRDDTPKALVPSPVCEDDASREIMVLEKDEAKLKAYISSLWAGGNTSIDLGMKWGTALLDPSTQPIIAHLIDENMVSSDFSERPHAYDDGQALKVIVLMTDGQNTSQYYIEDDYRTGLSDIWWNDDEAKYSVYAGLDSNGDPKFYWPHAGKWEDHPYGNGTEVTVVETEEKYCKKYNKKKNTCSKWGYTTIQSEQTASEPGEAVQLSYADLYAYTTLKWIVNDLYEPWMSDSQAWSDWYYDVRSYVGSTIKNSRTKAICDAAKAQDIIVFTIGFEAPSSGQAVLKDCASSDSHYFDVEGLEIQDAFDAIASSIAQLKLTQ